MTFSTTRWWLLRHAPVINPEGRIYGQGDVDVDLGDRAAFRALAAALPRGAVWLCTPLARTGQTAQAIRDAWHGDETPPERPVPVGDLVEQHFGAWQGLTHDELNARQPRAAQRFWIAPATERPPGGESFADMAARVGAALLRLSAEHAGRDVVCITHGGPVRAALRLALGVDAEAALRFRIDTLSLTRIDAILEGAAPPAWRVDGVNLPPGAAPPAT